MNVDMRRQVADQTRLFVQFVAALHTNDNTLFARDPVLAASAERTFEHLGELLRTCIEPDDVGGAEVVEGSLVTADTKRRIYNELIERIRHKVTALVPAGSVVAVVSRGDHPLLELPGLTGWHFPRNELGVWAGFYPSDGQHALTLINDVAADGAQYLLIPATGFWWLDFYEPLRHYLHTECGVVADDDDLMLFTLPAAQRTSPPSQATRTYDRQQAQFTRLVSVLLPAGTVVSVVTRGDPALLDLGGVHARHFPAGPEGMYRGTPVNDREAVAALESAISDGAEYFAVPDATKWWLTMFPLLHERLRTEHRCIAERREAGSVYHLSAAHPKEIS